MNSSDITSCSPACSAVCAAAAECFRAHMTGAHASVADFEPARGRECSGFELRRLRLLICGGRTLSSDTVRAWLHTHAAAVCGGVPVDIVIHGDAPGADAGADAWAIDMGIDVWKFPAKWAQQGNREMLRAGKPDVCIAFPGGIGTASMTKMVRETKSVQLMEVKLILGAP